MRAEAGDEADDQDQRALDDSDGGPAERAAEHDLHARHGSHQRFFEEPELTVPEHGNAGEDGAEQHRHPDHARRHELQIAAMAGLAEDRAQPKAQSQQIEARLAERDHDLHARAHVPLQFPQPENVNRAHSDLPPHLCDLPHARPRSLAASSRRVEPVSARNAPSSESVRSAAFSSAGVPWATIAPWSMMAMRWATRSASSM